MLGTNFPDQYPLATNPYLIKYASDLVYLNP